MKTISVLNNVPQEGLCELVIKTHNCVYVVLTKEFNFRGIIYHQHPSEKKRIFPLNNFLTHWGQVMHICVCNLTIIGSDNGLSPGRRQAIIWTNAGILFIGPLGTNFSEILIAILTFSLKKMRLKVLSGKWRPFCLGLNALTLACRAWIIVSKIGQYHGC